MRSVLFPLLAGFTAISLTACGGGTYELKEPYGPVQELRMDTEAGPLLAHVSPWQVAKKQHSTETFLKTNRKRAVDGQKVKRTASAPQKTKLDENVWMIARELKKKKGVAQASTLYACDYDGDGEFVRYIDIYGPAQMLAGGAGNDVRDQIKDTVETACEFRPSKARNAAIEAAIRTKPNKGTGRKKVSRILYATDTSYNGDFMGIDDDIYVLFKNKTAYRNPYVSVDDLNISRSKDLEANRWTKWRKRGKSYELRSVDKSGKTRWRKIGGSVSTLKRLKKGKRVDGNFQFVSTSGSYMYGSSSSWYYWNFDKKGGYSSSSSSFGGSGTMAFMNDFYPSYAHASSCSKDGGSSTYSSFSPIMTYSKTSNKDNCGDGKAGRYKVRGYTIELAADNGTVTRRPFYMHGKNTVVVGSRGYWRKSDKD